MQKYFRFPITGKFKEISKANNGKKEFCSKYGNEGKSTLMQGILKAIDSYIMLNRKGGAVGKKGSVYMAEYHSSVSDTIHIVSWDSDPASGGAFLASVYNTVLETTEMYSQRNNERDGAALFLCMMPEFLKEDEFKEQYEVYKRCFLNGTDAADYDFQRAAYILCDNVYRRLTNSALDCSVKADMRGVIVRISPTKIIDGSLVPDTVVEGAFEVLSKSVSLSQTSAASLKIDKKDFEGIYAFSNRSFLEDENRLIPKLSDSYIIPKEIIKICEHAKMTTDFGVPMRNFLLRGPAGTGKTEGAKAIAAGLHLPYMKYTCSSGTELFDFIGQFIPEESGEEAFSTESIASFDEMLTVLKLPSMEDIEFDPEGSYQMVTGISKVDATIRDVVKVMMEKMVKYTEKSAQPKAQEDSQGRFRYQETDFIKALENGYLIELQEPSTITMPGVLVGLNSMLEQGGSIMLPNGKRIKRHPDAVVVITTNVSYEGCASMNQSVVDRMDLVMDIPLPPKEVLFERAMAITKETDAAMVSNMVEVVYDMADYCRQHGIDDGEVGMRSLISWIMSTKVTKDPYEAAIDTVIAKATTNINDQEELKSSFLDPKFYKRGA